MWTAISRCFTRISAAEAIALTLSCAQCSSILNEGQRLQQTENHLKLARMNCDRRRLLYTILRSEH